MMAFSFLYRSILSILRQSPYGGQQIGYYLDEESGWSLDEQMLEDAIQQALAKGIHARAIVVINPGNPTEEYSPKIISAW